MSQLAASLTLGLAELPEGLVCWVCAALAHGLLRLVCSCQGPNALLTMAISDLYSTSVEIMAILSLLRIMCAEGAAA